MNTILLSVLNLKDYLYNVYGKLNIGGRILFFFIWLYLVLEIIEEIIPTISSILKLINNL